MKFKIVELSHDDLVFLSIMPYVIFILVGTMRMAS